MEYRRLPHTGEDISIIGLGTGNIHNNSDRDIEAIIRHAIDSGINYFDLCASGKNVYAPFGRAIHSQRDKVMFQLHFGAVYNSDGEYGWSRDLDEIKRTFEWELRTLDTDYADFGFLHCVDEKSDLDEIVSSGIMDYALRLKEEGRIRHLGFSSHTPSISSRILDIFPADMMMFSINPAYDLEEGDELAVGSSRERLDLFYKADRMGVGISVMKAFFGGKLLDRNLSPFKVAMTESQCISYALSRPGVMTVLPGVKSMEELDRVLGYLNADESDRDYSVISSFASSSLMGSCVYCNHCHPCPVGINIALANKYYDLALNGDNLAKGHYDKLSHKAGECIGCAHCDRRCPFKVRQSLRMKEIASYFGE